ncbi:hypothetical protein EVAR_67380_1 [Eumeta japonica]|uniref:Pre-C2HC domain-containing protein n=1 Tax=Eumeta variegata TaxID=151549 RepID=A0A4C1ZPS8_EUMVA|nr:hypothetical protein EVAR_67380_1 [Eumeta japonica]
MHINYTHALNTKRYCGIRISTGTIEDFRKLNAFLINNNIPLHTFVLEEERKVKVVIKGIPREFETADIKDDLINQGHLVLAARELFKTLARSVWSLWSCTGRIIKEVCPVNAIGVSYTDTRLPTVSLNRDALSVWSHTGPKTAIAVKESRGNPPAIIAVQTTRPTTVGAQKHLNLNQINLGI